MGAMYRACVAATLLMLAGLGTASAELQNVEIGGEIHIRGLYYNSVFTPGNRPAFISPEIRIPGFFLPKRPIGDLFGGNAVISFYDWDDSRSDYATIEQRTTLSFNAQFTNDVNAFIELESYDVWGEDFRSNYVTGFDRRSVSNDDVEIYQSYIEARDMFGMPLRARIGRQEILLGNQWLVGNNQLNPEFPGLSFDAFRLTYSGESYSIDVFWAKLAERFSVEQDADMDFAGIYLTCTALEDITFDAYWLWLRDAQRINDTNFVAPLEWAEDLFNLDDYDPTNLHTVGLRAAGTIGAFDFSAEAAYQFGEAGQYGQFFKPFLYGDDDAEFSAWAGDVEVGYTFDVAWQPRAWLNGAYFGGEDNREISFVEWLNPFTRPESSISFNRLFSNKHYSYFIDEWHQLTNAWTVQAGVDVKPTEAIEAGIYLAYFQANETFDQPASFSLGGFKVPLAPALSFWTQGTDDDLGWEAGIWARYHYSEDLVFEAGWSHMFTGDGLTDGNFVDFNGTSFTGGTAEDDGDYFYFDTKISF
ncbi:MAG: hypothetical protein AMXMBFR84_10950 [Candidatus Hydrogenedentota bacterium]